MVLLRLLSNSNETRLSSWVSKTNKHIYIILHHLFSLKNQSTHIQKNPFLFFCYIEFYRHSLFIQVSLTQLLDDRKYIAKLILNSCIDRNWKKLFYNLITSQTRKEIMKSFTSLNSYRKMVFIIMHSNSLQRKSNGMLMEFYYELLLEIFLKVLADLSEFLWIFG